MLTARMLRGSNSPISALRDPLRALLLSARPSFLSETDLSLLGSHAIASRALLWIVSHLGYATAHRSVWSRGVALNWTPYHLREPSQLMPAVAATPRRRLLDIWR
jgi:hypothetical protein